MNKALLGIDLGTSSVKALLYHPNGKRELARAAYEEISPRGWLAAMEKALKQLVYDICYGNACRYFQLKKEGE
jgi:sugar (pentulose or hexulose) kinase